MRVIAIDGPAGSGKSTVARAVAARLGFVYLDTGAMYRAVTAAALRANIDPADVDGVAALARRSRLEVGLDSVSIDGIDVTEEIRGPSVTAAVSAVAANPAVREDLVRRQRAWVAEGLGAVLEGRDIGTVVFPDAPLKVFLTASQDARAARRAVQGTAGTDHAAVAADLVRRDTADSTRATSPLTASADAVTVDTTDLSIDEVIERVLALWRERERSEPRMERERPNPVMVQASEHGPSRLDAAWNAGQPTRSARCLYGVVRAALVGFCYAWFRLEVTGRQHLPRQGAYIVAPVHRSNLDTPIVASITRRSLRFMGKDSLWKANRAFSWFISALGAFPVSRGSVDREALRRCQTVLEAGQPLVLYPEGTRQFGPTLHELYDGPAFLALRTGVPVIPVGIGGSERAQAKGSKFIKPTKVRVVIGAPILPPAAREGRATSRRAVRELTDELRRELQVLFDQARAGLPS